MLHHPRTIYVIAFLLFAASFLLQWNYGYSWADEGWQWYISQRVNLGDVVFRDFFSYDPGRYLWSSLFFRLFDSDSFFVQQIANNAFGMLGLFAAVITLNRAEISARTKWIAIIMLIVMLGYPRHKLYEQALSLICASGLIYALAAPQQARRWFIVGMLTGLAAFVGRNSGVYYVLADGLAIMFAYMADRRPKFLYLAGGIIVGYLPMLVMLATIDGLWTPFIDSILFVTKWQVPLSLPLPWELAGLKPTDAAQKIASSALLYGTPVLYAVSLKRHRGNVVILGSIAAGIPYLHEAYSRADFGHVAQGVLPAVLLLPIVAQQGGKLAKGVAIGFAAIALIAWLPQEPRLQFWRLEHLYPGATAMVDINGHDYTVTAVQAQTIERVRAVYQTCGSHQKKFLAMPYYPGIYPILHAQAPIWDAYMVWPRDDAFQQQQIARIEAASTNLVLLNRDAMVDAGGGTMRKLDNTNKLLLDYVDTHFTRLGDKLSDGGELWVRGDCRVE